MAPLNFNDFKIYHSELIIYCQIIENDLKWIYSEFKIGKPENNYFNVERHNLGKIVTELKALDNSDGNPILSSQDYNYLKQMTQKRNYWCHGCFLEFIYRGHFENSSEYASVCRKLIKDHDRFLILQKSIEQIKLKYHR